MRAFWAVFTVVIGLSLSGVAQEIHAKPSHSEGEGISKSMPDMSPAKSSTAASKQLQDIEHETAKTTNVQQARKTQSAALKPMREEHNPPINIGGAASAKQASTGGQAAGSYRGRLKQKGNGH